MIQSADQINQKAVLARLNSTENKYARQELKKEKRKEKVCVRERERKKDREEKRRRPTKISVY